MPEAKDGRWDFRVLVVDGRIASRARLPEEGCFEHLSEFNVTYMSAAGGHWQRPPTDEELTTLKYKPEDLGPWLDTNNAELVIFHMWSESLVGVAANDTSTLTRLRFKTKANSPPGSFRVNRYVVYNVPRGDEAAGPVVPGPHGRSRGLLAAARPGHEQGPRLRPGRAEADYRPVLESQETGQDRWR